MLQTSHVRLTPHQPPHAAAYISSWLSSSSTMPTENFSTATAADTTDDTSPVADSRIAHASSTILDPKVSMASDNCRFVVCLDLRPRRANLESECRLSLTVYLGHWMFLSWHLLMWTPISPIPPAHDIISVAEAFSLRPGLSENPRDTNVARALLCVTQLISRRAGRLRSWPKGAPLDSPPVLPCRDGCLQHQWS